MMLIIMGKTREQYTKGKGWFRTHSLQNMIFSEFFMIKINANAKECEDRTRVYL